MINSKNVEKRGECSCISHAARKEQLRESDSLGQGRTASSYAQFHLCGKYFVCRSVTSALGSFIQTLVLRPSLSPKAAKRYPSHKASLGFRVNAPSQRRGQLVPASLFHPLAVTALSVLRQLSPASPNLSSLPHGFTFSLFPGSHGGREKPGKAGAEPVYGKEEKLPNCLVGEKTSWFHPTPGLCSRVLRL